MDKEYMGREEQELISRNKIAWINFICAVMVVFIHSNTINSYGLLNDHVWGGRSIRVFEELIVSNFARGAVPLFFMISAFFMFHNFTYANAIDKIKRRFKSLIIPYLLVNTFMLFLFYFLAKLPFINTESFTLNFRNVIEGIFYYKYNYVFWFLYQLILYTFFCPVIYMLFRNKVVGFSILLILIIVVGFAEDAYTINFRSLFYYCCGTLVGIHYKNYPITLTQSPKRSGVLGVLFLVISQIFLVYSEKVLYNVLLLLFTVTLAFSYFLIISMIKVKPPKSINNISFLIYAFHPPIINTIQKLILLVFPHDAIIALINFLFSPLLTIFTIIIIIKILKKLTPKLLNIISGGRV